MRRSWLYLERRGAESGAHGRREHRARSVGRAGRPEAGPGVLRVLAEVLLDAQELVVLGEALRTAGAPVLICPQQSPTARSAMKESSVSPDRWDAMTPQPACLAIVTASMDSEMEPIWLILRSSALHDFLSIACCTRFGLVTSRSSPTIWTFSPICSVMRP